MKVAWVLIAGLLSSTGSLAGPEAHPSQLSCQIKNRVNNENSTAELLLDEKNGTVIYVNKELPATFTNSGVSWVLGKSANLQSGFMHRLDRYSGDLTVSVIVPESGKYIGIASGQCSAASRKDRKF